MIPTIQPIGDGVNMNGVRSALLAVMQMGMPNSVGDRITFIWDDEMEHTNLDSFGNPFDYNAAPTKRKQGKQVQALCAYEFVERVGHDTPIGRFENTRMEITILDVEYEKVSDAPRVAIGGNIYEITHRTPSPLFDMDAWVLQCIAQDES